MNLTKKLMLAAGLVFQLSGSLHADAFTDAFLAFSGKDNAADAALAIQNNQGSLPWANAKAIAKSNGNSPEMLAVALYMSDGNPNTLAQQFKGAASANNLQAALQNAASSAPSRQPSEPAVVAQPESSSYYSQLTNSLNGLNPLGGSSAASSTVGKDGKAVTVASYNSLLDMLAQAPQQQQIADAQAAAQNNSALQSIVASGKSGASLYNAYVDVVINNLQQAIAAIDDAAVQSSVQQYLKSKVSSISVAGSRYNSRTLGRMNSKKASKKSNKKTKQSFAQ